MKPLVSVLMTAYNRQEFIAEAIESVLESTFANIELIIVDDQSKDSTVTIAKAYAEKDSRIKVFVNQKNLGDYPNRNRAVSLASGEYILFCDSDDKLLPDTISAILSIVEKVPGFNFAMYWNHSNETFTLSSTEALRMHFLEKQFLYMGPGGTFIRRSYFNQINGYPEKYGPSNDMYFNLKAACYSSVTLIPFEFIFYRRHEGQEINNQFSYLYNGYCYLRDSLNELPLPFSEVQLGWMHKKNKRRFAIQLIKFFLRKKDLKKARMAFKKADFSLKYMLQGIFQLRDKCPVN